MKASISRRIYFTLLLCIVTLHLGTHNMHAESAPDNCDPIEGCPPAISIVDYNGWKGYRLTDGRSEAIIIPEIGRVMRFGLINGSNWLWNAPPATQKNKKPGDWKNWGGDKTWPAPQGEWSTLTGQAWPPDPAWDSAPHKAEVLTGAHLRTTSEISHGTGARVIREYWFDEKTGEFVIAQTVAKVRGTPRTLSIWSVTQIEPPDAIYLPANPQSEYPDKYHWLRYDGAEPTVAAVSPTLLKVLPAAIEAGQQKSFKLGVDSPVAAVVAVKNGIAFVQRTARSSQAARSSDAYPDGTTAPDGTVKSGFPVELYDSGQSTAHYMELELLSPLRRFVPGTRWTHTIRWKVHQLSSQSTEDAAMQTEIEKLLQ